MAGKAPIFTREEMSLFLYELKSKFRDGIRSSAGFLYISLTLIGLAWASWGIPSLNYSETSPETLGIYVIGFLISVMLDAMVTWKKKGSENPYEQAIAVIFMVTSLLLVILASVFSLKTFHLEIVPTKVSEWKGEWKTGATAILAFSLCCAISMSLVLTGIDPKLPAIGPLDNPLTDVSDRG